MKQLIWRTLLLVSGWCFVILGILGIFLPLLPTTVFLLLASACFMRGSPRLHHWLNTHPHFGPVLQNWHQHRAVSRTVKRRANVTIVLSFALSIYFVPLAWVKGLLLGIAVILLIWFNRLPVRETNSL
ncbi:MULTISPECIES: YbaN family protein [unclassified Photobacterium]|uniref:YbaN family protein n=1 Tax=unclassified Photobacterium TaxID=2628852 RepID=UPI001B8C5675|nr:MULTISPECIES: YbaN family protein [unclassified Photobacterium]MDO6705053.1 YbaN family protein [Photobacterium sp. 1_MG-2023]QUJ66567.1 YbaN family protein [Photobacterium sp. GJ3]